MRRLELARAAVELAATTVDIELRADALIDLGEVLRIAGREDEREPHIREALALYEQKGDLVSSGAIRSGATASETAAVRR